MEWWSVRVKELLDLGKEKNGMNHFSNKKLPTHSLHHSITPSLCNFEKKRSPAEVEVRANARGFFFAEARV